MIRRPVVEPSAGLHALVIDLDGVLVDSRAQMTVALEESYHEHCGPGVPPYDRFFSLMGMPLVGILETLALPREMASTYREMSRRALHLVRVFPGVHEFLGDAKRLGVRLALMTGKDRRRACEVLDRFRLSEYFMASVCGDDPFAGKPNPEGLVHLLTRLKADARRTALIGDSPLDMQCAVAGGVLAIGAEWGMSSTHELRAAGAHLTFTFPMDLRDWLERAIASSSAPSPATAGASV